MNGWYTRLCPHSINSSRPSDAYVPVTSAIIDSDNGLSYVRRQDIIWANAGSFVIGHFGKNSVKFTMK